MQTNRKETKTTTAQIGRWCAEAENFRFGQKNTTSYSEDDGYEGQTGATPSGSDV